MGLEFKFTENGDLAEYNKDKYAEIKELKDRQRKHAVDLMKALKLMKQPIKEYEKREFVNFSDPRGALYWVDGNEEQTANMQNHIAYLEYVTGAMPYHIVNSYTNMGEMNSYLVSSQYDEEWDYDMELVKDNVVFAFVENVTYPEWSEFGSIAVRSQIGGLVRQF